MHPAASAALGLVAGLALGLVLGRAGGLPGEAPESVVAMLEAELERERAASSALEERLAALDAEADEGKGGSSPVAEPSGLSEDAGGDPSAAGLADSEAGAPGDSEVSATGAQAGFDDARLLALGFHPSDIERLRRAWESLELERLFLENERVRSKKKDGSHWLRARQLENDVQADLGDDDFDALLYAAGDRNRVRVARVFPDSPAESAGFVEGDQITAYDGVPIFRNYALKNRTNQCEMGSSVAVTILRDGTERRVWAPCGPLGVQLEMINAPPR